MNLTTATYVTIAAPLVGFLIITLLGMRLPAKAASWVACSAVFVAFLGALGALQSGDHTGLAAMSSPWTWLDAGSFHVGVDFYVDRLATFMMLVVTGVGFLIHVYSIGYLDGDPQFRRFFAYLNIFIFAMLMLVMGGNLVMLLIGWGLVGMASYLLIGFWHDRPSAVAAAKKAFIMNAIGDVSIMLGLFLTFQKTGVLDYVSLPSAVGPLSTGTLTIISLLLLGGAVAKSAQLPLHTWLPDAMEGPTPVSALIHAATMVTAGVYLVARFEPFMFTRTSLAVTAIIGALTLTMAGFIALVQTDIKRVIAYSTMSQIGYMFIAVGVGATSAAMFHLMTHAFFKALLFLGAGIVIHALADEQDIRKMGGLRKHMPKTYALFLIGSLALAGIFPFAGFFSKDAILGAAFNQTWVEEGATGSGIWGVIHWGVYGAALFGALITGIYSFRLVYLVFHGEESELVKQYAAGELAHHGHGADTHAVVSNGAAAHGAPAKEAPATMFWTVGILGALSVVAGLLVVPGAWNEVDAVLQPAGLRHVHALAEGGELSTASEWMLALLVSMPMGLLGIGIATMVWLKGSWSGLRTKFPGAERVFQAGFGFDRLYDALFARSAQSLAVFTHEIVEEELIEPSMVAVGVEAKRIGAGVGAAHNGLVRFYAFATVVAMAAIVIAVVWLEV